MENNKESFQINEDNAISELIEIIRQYSPKACIIDPKRYFELLISKVAFDDLLKQCDERLSQIKFYPELMSASITAEVNALEVLDLDAFRIVMANANNFEVYPLLNGKMRISFMYRQVMCPIVEC